MAGQISRDPGLTLLWAWLVPGAGHWYTGRRGRGALYALVVIGVFAAGLGLGGVANVSAHQHKWAFLLQLFDGPMAVGAAVAAHASDVAPQAVGAAGEPAPAAGSVARAQDGPTRLTDLGLTFTLVSAAFNVLVMADAYYLADKPREQAA